MLSGIWYEYLTEFNTEMAQKNWRIVLVPDNCPSYPPPNLTHVIPIYLPKNTTPPDQGITPSPKSCISSKICRTPCSVCRIELGANPNPVLLASALNAVLKVMVLKISVKDHGVERPSHLKGPSRSWKKLCLGHHYRHPILQERFVCRAGLTFHKWIIRSETAA